MENGQMKVSLMEDTVKGSNFIIGLLMLNIVLLGWLANSVNIQASSLSEIEKTVIRMETKVSILWGDYAKVKDGS